MRFLKLMLDLVLCVLFVLVPVMMLLMVIAFVQRLVGL